MRFNVFVVLIISLILVGFMGMVSAGLFSGSPDYFVDKSYGSGAVVRGWINVSLDAVDGDSVIEGFDDEMNLLEFLDENNYDCSNGDGAGSGCWCEPGDCEASYSGSNVGSSETLNMVPSEEKIIGFKLEGIVGSIDSISFDVASDIGSSCVQQLKIDLLDDDNLDWSSGVFSDEQCSMDNEYGCYDALDLENQTILVVGNVYCEKIYLNGRGFKVGGDLIGSGSGGIEVSVNADGEYRDCDVSFDNGGEIGCKVVFEETLSNVQADVCISPTSLNAEYKINFEDENPCGYAGGFDHDFEIFAKPLKYSAFQNFKFNQSVTNVSLAGEIKSYVLKRFGNNCSDGCFVPLVFEGIEQSVDLSNLRVSYVSDGLTEVVSEFYSLSKGDFEISSDYLKLDLEKANLRVPIGSGETNLILMIGGIAFLREKVNIAGGSIQGIAPTEVPALVEVTFVVIDGDSNNSYEWDFGDGNSQKSSSNKIKYTYGAVGKYDLRVGIVGGESDIFEVKVISPEDSISKTIINSRKKLINVEASINNLSAWVRDDIKSRINFTSLRSELDSENANYDDGVTETEAIAIMKRLLGLKIPDNFGVSFSVDESIFIQDLNVIDLEVLEKLGAGSFIEEGDYRSAIRKWASENVELKLKSKTYSFYYGGVREDILSYVELTLTPDKKLEDVFFVIDGSVNEVGFVNGLEIKGGVVGKSFDVLENSVSYEFLYPGLVSIDAVPVYISPKVGELELGLSIGTCNNNGVCENGESSKNCINDCKPWFKTFFGLFILFVVAFFVYVGLQEWYKRHYENSLFPNRNQLFNLVNFMSISLNQGMKRGDMFSKLEDLGWKKEQLVYAWKKLRGKRTGMWEIPIFKWVENKKVKAELAVRGGSDGGKSSGLRGGSNEGLNRGGW